MFSPPNDTGSMLMVKRRNANWTWLYWKVEMEWDVIGNWKWMEMEDGKIKKRDENTGKNGKVNERSKWKNGKIMVKLTEVKDEKSRWGNDRKINMEIANSASATQLVTLWLGCRKLFKDKLK